MQKPKIGDTRYIIIEDNMMYSEGDACAGVYYRIARCIVLSLPHGSLREYKLHELDNHAAARWVTLDRMYETYKEAVKAADEKCDRYDSIWEKYDRHKLYRPWRVQK